MAITQRQKQVAHRIAFWIANLLLRLYRESGLFKVPVPMLKDNNSGQRIRVLGWKINEI